MARQRRKFTFELPCGYIDENDKMHTSMTVLQLDHQVDKDISGGMSSYETLARHTAEIGDYKDAADIKNIVPKLEKGDFDWALIQLIILSLGSDYKYTQECSSKTCKFVGNYVHDLEEIEVIEPPDRRVRTFEYTTPEDIILVFRTLKVKDIEDLSDLFQDGKNKLSKYLGLQLVSIGGVTPEKSLAKKGRKCKTATQHALEAIRMMDESEIFHDEKEKIRIGLLGIRGYPNLQTRSTCPDCGANFGHQIPVDYSFIVPSLGATTRLGSL